MLRQVLNADNKTPRARDTQSKQAHTQGACGSALGLTEYVNPTKPKNSEGRYTSKQTHRPSSEYYHYCYIYSVTTIYCYYYYYYY